MVSSDFHYEFLKSNFGILTYMKIEYEATYTNIEPDVIREKLKEAEAQLIRPEYLQRRSVFHMPQGNEVAGGWVRVRDEGNKITMSVKIVDGDTIQDQKESCIEVSDYTEAEILLESLGCTKKAYQESRRELWKLNDVEITIDTWPFLEPFVEVEGVSEETVKEVSEKIGFVWSSARFCAVGTLYSERFNLPEDVINNKTPLITFEMENPFVSK
jgi:adenylate cyclase, class 2